MKIKVGARESTLSRRQVEEVMGELGKEYEAEWVETMGDRDLESSLVPMGKTDFFTRDIDEMVLKRKCDVGVHSAKDLPEPLPKGLKMIALTAGVDSGDSLVMREGETFEKLKVRAMIGSSSLRRNEVIKRLRPDLKCVEVRGPVDKRLEILDRGKIDGLVVAEAALIRLGLMGRNRIVLPGETAPLQGKLAVIGREDDQEMENLFRKIDTREKRKALYLGLNPKHRGKEVFHFPIIEIIPRDFNLPEIVNVFADIPDYTHIIFTSKSGVKMFFSCLKKQGFTVDALKGKEIIAVGKITARHIEERGVKVDKIAEDETQEGITHLLALEDLGKSYILLPQSSRARCALTHSLMLRNVRHQRCFLYDTKPKSPAVKPDLENFNEIIFTSPSTVEAFMEIFGKMPTLKKITAIGSITQSKLNIYL